MSRPQEFNFEFLGNCYDPSTEVFSNSVALSDPLTNQGNSVRVGSVELNTPSFVKTLGIASGSQPNFKRCTYFTQEEYETQGQKGYRFDAGVKLWARGASAGRWLQSESGQQGNVLLRVTLEKETGKLTIPDIASIPRQRKFQKALDFLPNTYDLRTEPNFKHFFENWGTHIVNKVSLGGWLSIECLVKYSSCTRPRLDEVTREVGRFLDDLRVGVTGRIEDSRKRLHEMGIEIERIFLHGGISNGFIRTEALTHDVFDKWLRSVDSNPKEIKHSVELEALYNFVSGSKGAALRTATIKYLAHSDTERQRRLREEESRIRGEIEETKRQKDQEENRRREEVDKTWTLGHYPFYIGR